MSSARLRALWPNRWLDSHSRSVSPKALAAYLRCASSAAACRKARPCWTALPAPIQYLGLNYDAPVPRLVPLRGTGTSARGRQWRCSCLYAFAAPCEVRVRFFRCRSESVWHLGLLCPESPAETADGSDLPTETAHPGAAAYSSA